MRVLVPRFDTYGDLVLLQGLLAALASREPGAEIHLLVRKPYIDLAPLMPDGIRWHATEMAPRYAAPRPLYDSDDVMPLLREPWDLVLLTTFNRSWAEDGMAGHLTSRGVRTVAVVAPDVKDSLPAGVERVVVAETTHETEKYQKLYAHLYADAGPIPRPELRVPPAQGEAADAILAANGLRAGAYVVCVPGGGMNNDLKVWPTARFAECIARLEREHGRRCLILGHESETREVESAGRQAADCGASPVAWIGAGGQIGLAAALIAKAEFYFGNDTGPMHFAQSLGVPAVAVYGGGNWPRFTPTGTAVVCVSKWPCFGCGWNCLFGDAPCVADVTVEQVWEGVEKAVRGQTGPGLTVLERPDPTQPTLYSIGSAATRFRRISNELLETSQYKAEALVLRQESARYATEAESAKQENRRISSSIAFVSEQIAGTAERLRSNLQRLADTQSELFRLEEQLEAANARVSALESELAERDARVESLEGETRGIRAQNEELRGRADLVLQQLRDDPFAWLVASRSKPVSACVWTKPPETGKVSVVIPVYNGAGFIERCLGSVFRQEEFGGQLEVILCDDGSSDGSLELARTAASSAPIPVQVVTHREQANRGVSATRNRAMEASSGEFIALLDVDDTWHPRKLAEQIAYLREHPEIPGVCSYGHNRNLQGELVKGWNNSNLAGDYREVPPPEDFSAPYDYGQLLRGDPIVNSTVVLRRSAVERVGGYADVMAHQAEDWLLFQKIALEGPIHLIPQPLIDYTVHEGSYTTRYQRDGLAFGAKLETLYQLLHWLLQQPERRAIAEWTYRRHMPTLLAGLGRAHLLLEEYYRKHHGHTQGLEQFESHLCGVYQRLKDLEAYQQNIESQFDMLRRIPGFVTAYRLATGLGRGQG